MYIYICYSLCCCSGFTVAFMAIHCLTMLSIGRHMDVDIDREKQRCRYRCRCRCRYRYRDRDLTHKCPCASKQYFSH